jgi:signal transduction histidine kinase
MVDDQISNIALLDNMLARIGYNNIRSTTKPGEALGLIEQFSPDLVILDLMMPGTDGFQILHDLSATLPEGSYLPVLALTSDVTPATKRKALAAGATDFLQKPFDTSEIFMRIRNLLHTRFLHLDTQNQNAILEQKVAERTAELSAALDKLKETQRLMLQQERLRAFGEMAGGVVHDFNNALMSVIGYSELLLSDPSLIENKPLVLKYLKTMNTAGRDAAHVVSRLRDFYRTRKDGEVFETLDLNDVIEQAVSLTQPKWRDQALASGRTIDIKFHLEKIPSIAGNAAELREVFTNLIFNAADAMPAGGTISLHTRHAGGKVVFELADTGTGMSEEVRARCLDPFFSTKGEAGTGLGLSMVFGVVQRHDGELEIDTEVNRGTTFRITFPSQVKTFEETDKEAVPLSRPLRVLVVDDESVPREVTKQYLKADGHEVVTAATGQEAVEQFHASKFDLLITDHAMRGMNGAQLALRVKEENPSQPIMMLTGFSDPTLVQDHTPDGIDLILRKPIPQRELREAIAKLFPADQPN